MQVLTPDGTVVLADTKTTITLGEDTSGMFTNSNEYLAMCKHYSALHTCA